MDELERVEQELREIAVSNIREMGLRGELANELLSRLNESNGNGEPAPIKERVENALGLLATSAFTFAREDAEKVVAGLSTVCGSEFADAIFVDPLTERMISLMSDSLPLPENEARLRDEFRELAGRLEINFADEFDVDGRLDNEPPEEPTPTPRMG